MQLLLSLTSPFARKVRVALHEKGLHTRVEEIIVDPWADDPDLLATNPLLQVPALRLDDELALTNSDTIVGWLERAFPHPSLLASDPTQRSMDDAIGALAQGVIEYAVFLVLERRRPEAQRSDAMQARRTLGIERAVAAIAERFPRRTDEFHAAAIGVACALAYLDFRHPQLAWRERHAALADWLDWANARPSMQATAPPT